MLTIKESAYNFDCIVRYEDGSLWFQFSTVPKENFDVKRVITQRVRFERLDGTSQFLDAAKLDERVQPALNLARL